MRLGSTAQPEGCVLSSGDRTLSQQEHLEKTSRGELVLGSRQASRVRLVTSVAWAEVPSCRSLLREHPKEYLHYCCCAVVAATFAKSVVAFVPILDLVVSFHLLRPALRRVRPAPVAPELELDVDSLMVFGELELDMPVEVQVDFGYEVFVVRVLIL